MGTVNIFLGGTGKHIAEDIQDNRDFFGQQISEPIAFDLDAATRSGVNLRGFVHPSQSTIDDVRTIAGEWAKKDTGPAIGPAESATKPGPRVAPEHSILVGVGKGIAANPSPTAGLYALRGHGLTVFSALFDPGLATAGAGDGNRLRAHIRNTVVSETYNGGAPRINLITSTAGGTGAGTVVPLALWLRGEYRESPLTLVAVTPDAFETVLRGSPNLEELAAKGRSGTYALFRELSFLQEVDPQARFSARRLPATASGLEYTPGQKLFDRIYWFGGRGATRPSDAFEEAGALIRILSSDDTADELRGKSGAHPLQSVGAVTAIEYPRLRLQRKLVSRVLVAAYDRLRSPRWTYEGGDATERAVSLLDHVAAGTTRRLGAWLYGQRNASLALNAPHSSLTSTAARTLATSIHDEAGVEDYAAVDRGTRIRGGNYDAGESGWRAYVAELTDGLRRAAQRNQQKLQSAIPALRAAEEEAFALWLRDTVFGDDGWLSGEAGNGSRPDGIVDVRSRLERLENDARELEERVGQDNYVGGRTISELDAEIEARTNKLAKPDNVLVKPSAVQRLFAVGAAVAVALVGGLALRSVWEGISRFGEFGGTSVSEILVWVGVTLATVAAYRVVTWALLRSRADEAKLSTRRHNAEDQLFGAFRERDLVRALRWLHLELSGPGDKAAFFRELRHQLESVRAVVDDLDDLYEGLRDQAAAEVAQAASSPAHVRATVGDSLEEDQGVATGIVPEITSRLHVDATLSPDHRVRSLAVRLDPFDTDEDRVTPAQADVRTLLAAIDPDRVAGRVEENEVANRWKGALWELVNWKLGEDLPETFDDALKRYDGGGDETAATRALAAKLNTLNLPRPPSVELRVAASDPVFRQLYAGGDAIRARFTAALNDPTLDPAVRSELGKYALDSRVVGSLGEQLIFFDLWADDGGQPWAPHVISNAAVAEPALRTYYGAANAPMEATARDACFTVIPELLAATKVELGGNVRPLAPAVTARLLGSDLDVQGPTYAELFYLLRARGHLVFDIEGAGPEARRVVRLDLDGGRPMGLVEHAPGDIGDTRFFDAARGKVIAFDSFCDFMRFDGTPLIAGQGARSPYGNARLLNAEWAGDPRRVARLQRAAIIQWYEGDIDADCEAMIRELEVDLHQMQGESEDGREARRSWEQAMRRLLDGDERRRIRRTLLTASNR